MSVQSSKLERMFDSDSTIMLETLRKLVGAVGPGELAGADVDRAFRAAHSIKSEAGFLGLPAIAAAAHELEDGLTGVRRADGRIDAQCSTSLRRRVAVLETALASYRASRAKADRTDSNGAQEADAGFEPAEQAGAYLAITERGVLREARLRGERLYRVVLSITCDPQLRYARGFLVVNNLELSCAVIRMEPALEHLQRAAARQLTITVSTPGDETVIQKAVHVDEVETVEITELSYDELLDTLEEQSRSHQRRVDDCTDEPVQVSVDSQEEIMLLADEIVAAARELSDADRGGARAHRVAAYAAILQDRTGWTARVQLLDLFREVRTSSIRYAAGQDKRVRVVVGGQGALVPPAVGDALLEALMHLLRNAIEHGILPIGRRRTESKNATATIKVRVDRIGARVRIVVQDDGTGIDEASVRERAGDRDAGLLEILARPGFSMRADADTGSGRGVGLDNVVHTVRTLLGGEIRLVNRPGEGVTIVMTVSSAVRLVRVLVVESGGQIHAVARAAVVSRRPIEMGLVKRDSLGSLYYEYDGRVVPLSTVNGRTPPLRVVSRGAVGLIVRAGVGMRVLVVDAVLGEEAVVRNATHKGVVHSRTVGRDIPFVLPSVLAVEPETPDETV